MMRLPDRTSSLKTSLHFVINAYVDDLSKRSNLFDGSVGR
jgi:hypothetical protein